MILSYRRGAYGAVSMLESCRKGVFIGDNWRNRSPSLANGFFLIKLYLERKNGTFSVPEIGSTRKGPDPIGCWVWVLEGNQN